MITTRGHVKILCVDDERNVLRALERIFLDDDYEIVLAGSGEEGFKIMAESGPFQVVISDYRMPVMNGVEFLKGVYERWPDTVRIVLSGYADAGAIVSAINEGHIYRFIPKPWNDDELRVTIQNCIERYDLQKSNLELLEKLAVANQLLEEKVLQRTEQLECRNSALEFSQRLVGNLPVGVIGVGTDGVIAYCNDMAAKVLQSLCQSTLGADVFSCCEPLLGSLIMQVRREKCLSVQVSLATVPYKVLGRIVDICGNEAVVLVFIEMSE